MYAMQEIGVYMGTPKVKSATALRSDLYDTLKEVSEGKKQMITHKQGEPVVLLSVTDYDKLLEEQEFLRQTAIGLAQLESGDGVSHQDALKKFTKMQKKWK